MQTINKLSTIDNAKLMIEQGLPLNSKARKILYALFMAKTIDSLFFTYSLEERVKINTRVKRAEDRNGGVGRIGRGESSLILNGWTWLSKPVVDDDDSNDTGTIRFKIKVDSDGDVVDISLIESAVSPTIMQKYKRIVQKTKFTPTSDGNRPEYSSGTITFKLNPR